MLESPPKRFLSSVMHYDITAKERKRTTTPKPQKNSAKDATTLRTRKVQKDTKLSAKDAKKSISATYGKDPIDEIER